MPQLTHNIAGGAEGGRCINPNPRTAGDPIRGLMEAALNAAGVQLQGSWTDDRLLEAYNQHVAMSALSRTNADLAAATAKLRAYGQVVVPPTSEKFAGYDLNAINADTLDDGEMHRLASEVASLVRGANIAKIIDLGPERLQGLKDHFLTN